MVTHTAAGDFKRDVFCPANQNVELADTGLVVRAPVRLLVSGMEDALARLCYETLLNYGVLAKSACEAKIVTPALERVVEANTLLSGLGFESGGLAAAHAIHNGLTALAPTHRFYHGEKVAVGTLASLFLTDKSAEVIDEVYSFSEAVGLPTTLARIGLADASDEALLRAAVKACAEGETIHNEPVPVSPASVFAALRAMDAECNRRLASL